MWITSLPDDHKRETQSLEILPCIIFTLYIYIYIYIYWESERERERERKRERGMENDHIMNTAWILVDKMSAVDGWDCLIFSSSEDVSGSNINNVL